MSPIGRLIPMLTPSASRVYVCRTSTKSASSGERRLSFSTSSNRGPAGSRPEANAKFNQFKDKKNGILACLCRAEITGNPANGPSHVRPGISGYVSTQTVAYQVHVLQGELLFILSGKEVATFTSAAATTNTKHTFKKSWDSARSPSVSLAPEPSWVNPDRI